MTLEVRIDLEDLNLPIGKGFVGVIGCRFVFRQGSPLIPNDLRGVAAAQAGATIVVSDSNR